VIEIVVELIVYTMYLLKSLVATKWVTTEHWNVSRLLWHWPAGSLESFTVNV